MGLRTLCRSPLEQSCHDTLVGARTHACTHAGSRLLRLPVCFELEESLGRNPLPGCLCLYSSIPGFRPSRSHRHRCDLLLTSDSLELRHHVAISWPPHNDVLGSLVRRSSPVEILLGATPVWFSR